MAEAIANGQTSLGIELGSTNIKACLVGPDHQVIATGSHGIERPARKYSSAVRCRRAKYSPIPSIPAR